MTEVPMSTNAARIVNARHIVAALVTVGTVAGAVVGALLWFGWLSSGPGDRIQKLEVTTRQQGQAIEVTRNLVEGLAVKSCLDADSSVDQRDNLARSGIPCDALFRAKGLRPGRRF